MKRLYIIIITILFAFTACRNKNERNIKSQANKNKKLNEFYDSVDTTESQVYLSIIETMPEFPGGQKALISFITNNTNYPQSAIDDSIEGRVVLKFVIKEDGYVSRAEILRSIRYDLDNECIRVINSLPKWTPGKQYDKPVHVWYCIPFTFLLHKNQNFKGPFAIYPKLTEQQQLAVNIFPNPTHDFVNIHIDTITKDLGFYLTAMNGQVLKRDNIKSLETQLDLSTLANGMYFLTFNSPSLKFNRSFKIILEK